MALSPENQEQAKKVIIILSQGLRAKMVRIPERVEEISLKWLREAPFFSEFLLRFNYYMTESIPTMAVSSRKGRINLYLNDQFMNGGGERVKIGADGKPILKLNDKGDPILDKQGNVEFEMEPWKGLSNQELEGVLVHEIMHLVRLHHERIHDSEPYVWNIAGDMIINDDIQNDFSIGNKKIKLPDGAIYLSMAKTDGYAGENITEPLYSWLLEKKQEYLNMMQDLMKNGGTGEGTGTCPMCGGSGKIPDDSKNQEGDGEEKADEGKEKGSGQSGGEKTCPCCGGSGKGSGRDLFDAVYGSNIDTHEPMTKSDELAESTIKEVIDTGRIRGWGNISGNMIQRLEELTKPAKLPWPKLLRKALANYVYSAGRIYENSWSKKNRRALPLPGIKKLTNRVVIGVDTSGSISNDDIEQFFAETEKIIKDGTSVTLVQWDTTVKSVKEGYKRGDWKKIEIKGRGGTDVQNTFDWMIENKHQHDLLVMLTDGQFSYGYDTHGVNVLWCVTYENMQPPGGKIVYIDIE